MKKAILVVSFGTTFADTRKKTIDVVEEKIRLSFPDYNVRRAYTAHIIINRLKKRDNIHIDTPEEALQKLMDEGYREVIVQPLHIIPGLEYDYIKAVVSRFRHKRVFEKLSLGRPALFFKGGENAPDDYEIFVEAIEEHLNKEDKFVLMGHGTAHHANACYACLQQVLGDKGYNNVYIGNVEGYPEIPVIIDKLIKDQIDQVTLKPLMLVSGDHARNDMVGDDHDSWQNQLARQGIKSDADMRSLGEIGAFQDIYVQHVEDVIKGTYDKIGVSRKIKRILA